MALGYSNLVDGYYQLAAQPLAALLLPGQHQGRFLAVLRVRGVDFVGPAPEFLQRQQGHERCRQQAGEAGELG